jgi:hypothetical protein
VRSTRTVTSLLAVAPNRSVAVTRRTKSPSRLNVASVFLAELRLFRSNVAVPPDGPETSDHA